MLKKKTCFCCVSTVIATALVVASAPSARAEVATASQFDAAVVYADVDNLIKQHQAAGTMPKLSDPGDGEKLKKFWDAKAFLRDGPYTKASVQNLLDMLTRQNTVLKAYVETFMKNVGSGGDPKQVEAASKLYENEMAQGLNYQVKTIGALLPAITDFVAKLPPTDLTEVRLSGLNTMRSGLIQSLTGAAMTFQDDGHSPQNQEMISASLASSAPSIADGLRVDQRAAVRETLMKAMSKATEGAKPHLQSAITHMEKTDCTGLCKIK
jgi:hypothetical protein